MLNIGILNLNIESKIELEGLDSNIIRFHEREERTLADAVMRLDAIIIFRLFKISAYTIDRLKRCKIIVAASAGYDHIDYKYAGEKGIPVFNIPDYGEDDIADHGFALLLSYVRKIQVYDTALKKNIVKGWDPAVGGQMNRLAKRLVGIVGFGRIGRAFALRAKAFGMDVIFFDPYLPDGYERLFQVKRAKCLCDLVKESDIISIHVPLQQETEKLFNADLIRCAEKFPIIINTSRGKVVDLDAIYFALMNHKIEAFLADVCEEEPPLAESNLIKAYMSQSENIKNRVLFTPHAASYAKESRLEIQKKAVAALKNFFNGQSRENCINMKYLKDISEADRKVKKKQCFLV